MTYTFYSKQDKKKTNTIRKKDCYKKFKKFQAYDQELIY